MSNTRQHRQWIREDQSEDNEMAKFDREVFLGLMVRNEFGQFEITESNIHQLINS